MSEQPPEAGGKQRRGAPPAADPRDATIERLDRALAEERQEATTLRQAIAELRFKAEILEKSYSKQLADTRDKCAKAERAVAEHQTRLAELGTGGEDTLKKLGDVRAELAQVTAERNQLRAELAAGGKAKARTPVYDDYGSQTLSGQTINELISNPNWVNERKAAEAQRSAPAAAPPPEEAPVGDMLAPELVFTKDSKDKGDGEDDDPVVRRTA